MASITSAPTHNDFAKYAVGELEVPEYCFKQEIDLTEQKPKSKKRQKNEEENTAFDYIKIISTILAAQLNTCGGLLHLIITKCINAKQIDEWFNSLPSKCGMIPKDIWEKYITVVVVHENELFIITKKTPDIVIHTPFYWRDASQSQASYDINKIKIDIEAARYELDESVKEIINKECLSSRYKLPPENECLEYKHWTVPKDKNVNDVIMRGIENSEKQILSLANTKGGAFIIGVNDNREVIGLDIEENNRVELLNRLELWMKGRFWGEEEPHRETHWDLKFIPVELDACICVLIMYQSTFGVFPRQPIYYRMKYDGDIIELQYLGFSGLKKIQKPVLQIDIEKPSLQTVTQNPSLQTVAQKPVLQTVEETLPNALNAASYSKTNKLENVFSDRAKGRQPLAQLNMNLPMEIIGIHKQSIEARFPDLYEDFANMIKQQYNKQEGFAFLVVNLWDCIKLNESKTIDNHAFDVVVCFSECCQMHIWSCFTSNTTSANERQRREYMFQIGRVLKFEILDSCHKEADLHMRAYTFVSPDKPCDITVPGTLRDKYYSSFNAKYSDRKSFLLQFEKIMRVTWIKNRVGETEEYTLTQDQIDAIKKHKNKISFIEGAPGCGKSIIANNICQISGDGRVLFAGPKKGFLNLIAYQGFADVVLVKTNTDWDEMKHKLDEHNFDTIVMDDVQFMSCTKEFWTVLLESYLKSDKINTMVLLGDSKYQDYTTNGTIQAARNAIDDFCRNSFYPNPEQICLTENHRNTQVVQSYMSEHIKLITKCFKTDNPIKCGNPRKGDDVHISFVPDILDVSDKNGLVKLLRQLIGQYAETDMMVLLADGDERDVTKINTIIKAARYRTCTAADIPHRGIVVDSVDETAGLEAPSVILIFLTDQYHTGKVQHLLFGVSRGISRIDIILPRPFTPDEAKRLGLDDITQADGMPDRYNPAAVREVLLSGVDPGDGIWGLAVSADGEILLADHGNDQIRVLSERGEQRSVFPVAGVYRLLEGPWDVCVTPAGSVAVACGDTVRLYDRAGGQVFQVGGRGDGLGEYQHALGIISDKLGQLYIADYNNPRVTVLDSDGQFIRHIGTDRSEGVLDRPRSVAVHPHTGLLYVADIGRDVVAVYSSDGKYRQHITGVPAPWYITFRTDGLLAVCSRVSEVSDYVYNWSVYLIRDDRQIQSFSVGTGSAARPSAGFLPGGELVVCHRDGRLLIYATHSIQ